MGKINKHQYIPRKKFKKIENVIQPWNPVAYRPPNWLLYGPTGAGKLLKGS
jgi:DNA replication protein DnaC